MLVVAVYQRVVVYEPITTLTSGHLDAGTWECFKSIGAEYQKRIHAAIRAPNHDTRYFAA
jgi:hypothetical protein